MRPSGAGLRATHCLLAVDPDVLNFVPALPRLIDALDITRREHQNIEIQWKHGKWYGRSTAAFRACILARLTESDDTRMAVAIATTHA